MNIVKLVLVGLGSIALIATLCHGKRKNFREKSVEFGLKEGIYPKYPEFVRIEYVLSWDSGFIGRSCEGVLIEPDVVLTTASCANQMAIRNATTIYTSPWHLHGIVEHSAKKICLNKKFHYEANQFGDNFAVYILDKEVKDAQVVKLGEEPIKPGTVGIVISEHGKVLGLHTMRPFPMRSVPFPCHRMTWSGSDKVCFSNDDPAFEDHSCFEGSPIFSWGQNRVLLGIASYKRRNFLCTAKDTIFTNIPNLREDIEQFVKDCKAGKIQN